MSDLLGCELPPNLFELLARRTTVAVVATVDDDGWPHAAPYSQVVAVDPRHLRLAVARRDATYQSLRDYGLVMVEILEEGDIAAGIKGRARILRERMRTDDNLAVVEIEIDEVKRDNSTCFLVTQGVRTRLRQELYLLQLRQIMNELKA